MDWKNAKYTITELISTYTVWLNTPLGIHPVFYMNLLWPVLNNPLSSQVLDDTQPPAVMVDGEEEFIVEEILDEKCIKRGRGSWLEYKVKWLGYTRPIWEGTSALEESSALDDWQECTKHAQHPNGQLDCGMLN